MLKETNFLVDYYTIKNYDNYTYDYIFNLQYNTNQINNILVGFSIYLLNISNYSIGFELRQVLVNILKSYTLTFTTFFCERDKFIKSMWN